MNATKETHLFEKQGFGPGPYLLIGHNPSCTVQTKAREAGVDLGLWPGPDQAAGTCDSCGQGIKDVYTLRSASGVEFDVGCECVRKAAKIMGDKKDPALLAIGRIKAKAAKKREAKRIEDMMVRLTGDEALRATLAGKAHPQKWRAEQGENLLDSMLWMMANAGHAGKIKTVRRIEKLEKAAR